ncbi:MAG TPA: SLBB domain-containing protein, partial [candidate division Zixibacteria bacterium]|nr:SLBB domain-containing protein [candidate division Zixibacteria bacterium]
MKVLFAVIVFMAYQSSAFGQTTPLQFDQPVDANQYIIRPGDALTVTFLKANIEPLKLVVDPEGRIIHSQLGMFELSHKTLTETKQILKAAIKTLYKVESVVISITDPLLVRFSITGAVKSPGFYEGYTSQRISDAVKLAEGVLGDGSSRRIVLSGGPENIIVDLDRAIHTGDLKYDPCLYAGYRIHVPQKTGNSIQVIGEVNAPREIELLVGDDLGLLISLAGGYRSWADSTNIQVFRNGDVLDAFTSKIQSSDIIKVNALLEIAELHKIAVFGAVAKPGKFDAKSIRTIDELLSKSGGFLERAVPERTTAFRFRSLD